MFTRPTKGPDAADTPRMAGMASLIADGLTLKGEVATAGDLHLDGTLDGDLRVGRLNVGESGLVTGTITADSAEIRGRVRGTITARQVKLCATARVQGDIVHAELAIEAGAAFEGRSIPMTAEPALSVAAE